VLRRSRDILDRYTGRDKSSHAVPTEGFTVNTLTEVVYAVLGGRLPDVARFVNRVSSTRKKPLQVLQEMEGEAQALILNRAFGKKLFIPVSPGVWTQPQAWKCIKLIAAAPDAGVPFEQVVLSVFKGDRKNFIIFKFCFFKRRQQQQKVLLCKVSCRAE
jgi:hypothetical protein